MPFIPLVACVLTLVFIAGLFDFELGIVLALLVGLLSLQLVIGKRMRALQRELNSLRRQIADLSSAPAGETAAEPLQQQADSADAGAAQFAAAAPAAPVESEALPAAAAGMARAPQKRVPGAVDRFEDLLRKIEKAVIGYFTDGNIFVRVGLLILFFGVAFLLKYAAENSRIPLEVRFLGAAAGGLALLIVGWRLRLKKAVYGLLLQGGGLGIIYITVFAAYQLADLLPPMLAFALMVFFSLFTVALAVLQDSRALAVFAIAGGFLAPLLASSGSGNFVGLFSYYALLNAAVFAVAWFKAWRLLNLLGFVFTFGVFAAWMIFSYLPTDLVPAMLLLSLFFLMYSLIGVLYAFKQPERLTGLVDGTLVFGAPVVSSSLMMAMLRDYDYGIAAASAGLGFYYLVLAKLAWHRAGPELRLLCEAMLAIGVVFATLAIPYSLDGHWSSASWALEAAGILWVSLRQHRFYAQCFAIALQLGAGLLFMLTNIDDIGDRFLMNPAFLGGLFIALGAFISARILYLQAAEYRLRLLHIVFFVWAMGWWLFSSLVQIEAYLENEIIAWLLLFVGTALLLVYLDRVRQWDWRPASICGLALLPILALIALYSFDRNEHLLVSPDIYFWPAAFYASYLVIRLLEPIDWPRWISLSQHTGFVFLLACLSSLELFWLVDEFFSASGDGFAGLIAVFPLLFIYAAQNSSIPAIGRLGPPLQYAIIASLLGLLSLWSLVSNLVNDGNPVPLPYLPFINPLDLAQIAFFIAAISSLKILPSIKPALRQQLLILLAALVFIWLTAVLTRSMHHYLDIRYDLSAMASDSRVQTAISILWTILGMLAMLVASRRLLRPLWIGAAGLIAVVLLKMIFIDLGASGTVERIVSFLVVGSLLVAMGYFSPIPQKPAESSAAEAGEKHA